MSFKSAGDMAGLIVRSLALDVLAPIMAQPLTLLDDQAEMIREGKSRGAHLESLWEAQQIQGALLNELEEEHFAPYLELIRMKALTDPRWNIVLDILEGRAI
jgi:hypothetical protein